MTQPQKNLRPTDTPPSPPLRHCREDRTPFYATRMDQDFCCRACRQAHHTRRMKRGLELIDFAMEWRGKRLKGGFTRLCQMLDGWLREDKARRKANKERIAAAKRAAAE